MHMRRFFASCVPRRRVHLVGLKERQFYGEDGSETALNMLKNTEGPLYVGIPDEEIQYVQPPKDARRIQPIKEIEHVAYSEFIPPIQAAILEKRTVKGVDRRASLTVACVAMETFFAPREAMKVWKHIFINSEHKMKKDDAFRAHFQLHFPHISRAYLDDRAELMAVSMLLDVGEQEAVLVVPLSLYPLVEEYIGRHKNSSTAELTARKEALVESPGSPEMIATILFILCPLIALWRGVGAGFSVFDAHLFGEQECRK